MSGTPAEKEAMARLEAEGCFVLKSGWPDLFVRNKVGRVFGLELKSNGDSLRPSQRKMLDALKDTGLLTYVRRYDELDGIAEDPEIGWQALAGAHAWSHDEAADVSEDAFDEGFTVGYEEGYEDAAMTALGEILGTMLTTFGREYIEEQSARALKAWGRERSDAIEATKKWRQWFTNLDLDLPKEEAA